MSYEVKRGTLHVVYTCKSVNISVLPGNKHRVDASMNQYRSPVFVK